jgi:ribosomal protein L35AE/L33A
MYSRQCIVVAEGISNKAAAEKLLGKKVVWKSLGKHAKTISGRITAPHGNKGSVRVAMQRGLPGQAIGSTVEIK